MTDLVAKEQLLNSGHPGPLLVGSEKPASHTYPYLAALLYLFALQAFWPVQTAKETFRSRDKEPLSSTHASSVPVLPWLQARSLGQRLEARLFSRGLSKGISTGSM